MKRRYVQPEADAAVAFGGLCDALCALQGRGEVAAFLRDLCTPAELEAMSDRWRVVAPLTAGIAYRSIHDQSGVSATTIGRVARCLNEGEGGYRLAAQRLAEAGDPAFSQVLKDGRLANDERH
ncbi:MAG: DNA-binding transcriptional regulator [Rhodanobacteraceae bacterium]|nr:DNA-binding transcriptional regulator [Xanthomonadales bacterium]MCP5479207.1 DNA-binding transcriptional regulator [Rhodanobacteraceae bacterium]HPF73128.1 YerC/YecD family TrpR-related protein [Xanthomonadaceae bacterium]HRX99680.1 YerC/YecD family TrpR-related protein [Xanthomonadaceae bacterium]